jgi:hypothetical protein
VPWTQADLDRLDRAIASGAKASEFRSGDTIEKIEFRSYQDMLDLRARIQAALAPSAAGNGGFVPTSHNRD